MRYIVRIRVQAMKGNRKKIVISAVVAAAAVPIGVWLYRWATIPGYELIDLGSLGGKYGDAKAINNRGQVEGL